MAHHNPEAVAHLANVAHFLAEAEESLGQAEEAFLGGQIETGWGAYLEAFREIARAQQEVVYAADDPALVDLDELDALNERINIYDEMIRRTLFDRLNVHLPVDQMFALQTPTPVIASAELFQVPIGPWEDMRRALIQQALARYGSVRKASAAIGVPRSTLNAWASGMGA